MKVTINASVLAVVLVSTTVGAVGMQAQAAPTSGIADVEGSAQTRIINGEEITDQKNNPGAVLISQSRTVHCSATRISPTWVISARHCDKMPAEAGGQQYRIDGVWTDAVRPGTGPKAAVKRVISAPQGDQMLLEIDGLTPGPIAAWSAEPLKVGDPVVMMGWGAVTPQHTPTKILKKANGTFKSRDKGVFFGGFDAIIAEGNGIAWTGDSGGPLFKDGKVVADLSWGDADTAPAGKRTNGYVPFDQNKDWIISTSGVQPDGVAYYYTPGQNPPGPGGPTPGPTAGPTPAPTPAPTPKPTRPTWPGFPGWPGRP